MGRTPIAGISGVLGELIGPSADAPPQAPASQKPPRAADRGEGDARPLGARPVRQHARLGRPPGRSHRIGKPKEKVTLRIDAELIAQYRDWSWEKRCQLGELLEQALRAYRASRTS